MGAQSTDPQDEPCQPPVFAYVLIKTDLGTAGLVAQAVSDLPGVLWADVITGPFDVIAVISALDLTNEALCDLVVDEVQLVPGVRNALTAAVGTGYGRGHKTFP